MRKIYKKLTLRLTMQEYIHLKTQADVAGMKLEPLLRQLVMGMKLRPRPPDSYAALLRELNAIGSNVNQIAYWANAQKNVSEGEIAEAVRLVRRAWRLVKDGL